MALAPKRVRNFSGSLPYIHWVVHESVFSEANRKLLKSALERAGLPYTLVSFDSDEEPIPDVAPEGRVFVCGAWKAQRLAKRRGWVPGSFLNENFSVEVWSEHLKGELLNEAAYLTTVANLDLQTPMFVRPVADSKAFDGAVLTPEAVDNVLSNSPALAEVRVAVSPVRTIMREYRLFFVNGKLVTGSLYRQAGEVVLSREVDPDAVSYGEGVAQRWSPAEAFVMDIALTEDGYRVIEFNNINSSGFYAADVERYVDAIERAFGGSD